MKKNYIQPTVDLFEETMTQTLMDSGGYANLQKAGNTSQPTPLIKKVH